MVFNQLNPPLESTLTLTVAGPGDYCARFFVGEVSGLVSVFEDVRWFVVGNDRCSWWVCLLLVALLIILSLRLD